MKVWTNEEQFDLAASVVALGMFDGVHIGHQALIRRAKALSDQFAAACVVCTYDRNPLSVLAPGREPMELTRPEEKLEKLEKLGVDGVLMKSFTPEYAHTDALEYLKNLVRDLRVRGIVAGFNYTFGAGGRGDAQLLLSQARALHYRAEIVDAVHDGCDTVSSTLIRRLLAEGDQERAERLLQIEQAEK